MESSAEGGQANTSTLLEFEFRAEDSEWQPIWARAQSEPQPEPSPSLWAHRAPGVNKFRPTVERRAGKPLDWLVPLRSSRSLCLSASLSLSLSLLAGSRSLVLVVILVRIWLDSGSARHDCANCRPSRPTWPRLDLSARAAFQDPKKLVKLFGLASNFESHCNSAAAAAAAAEASSVSRCSSLLLLWLLLQLDCCCCCCWLLPPPLAASAPAPVAAAAAQLALPFPSLWLPSLSWI